MSKPTSTQEREKIELMQEDPPDVYCKECGGCGYIGCCGIKSFLKKHVEGKTNCLNEAEFISDIISYCQKDA